MASLRKLGLTTRYSLVIDEDSGQSSLHNCVAHLLANTPCQSVYEHVINGACQAHHAKYRSSTKTLHALLHIWLEEMQELIRQGIPRHAIINGFQQAVTLCVKNLGPVTINLGQLINILENSNITLDFEPGCDSTRHMTDNSREKSSIKAQEEISGSQLYVEPNTSPNSMHNMNKSLDNNSTNIADHEQTDEFVEIQLSKVDSESQKSENILAVEQSSIPIDLSHMCSESDVDVPFVELKMHVENEKTDDKNDDVDWFFDDNLIPNEPQLDEEIIDIMTNLNSEKVMLQDNQVEKIPFANGMKDLLKPRATSLQQVNRKNENSEFSQYSCSKTRNTNKLEQETLDEFDSCFEKETVSNEADEFDSCFDTATFSNSKANKESKPRLASHLPCGVDNPTSGNNSEDEFGSCVGNESDKPPVKSNVDSVIDVTESKTSDRDESSTVNKIADINKQLQSLLGRKPKSNASKINLANSRHFRTMKDVRVSAAEAENNSDTKHEHFVSDLAAADDMSSHEIPTGKPSKQALTQISNASNTRHLNENGIVSSHNEQLKRIQKTLNEIKASGKQVPASRNVLRTSRHFKTIADCEVDSSTKSKEITTSRKSHATKADGNLGMDTRVNSAMVTTKKSHVCSDSVAIKPEKTAASEPEISALNEKKLKQLVQGLSHGCDYVTNAVCDVISIQMSQHRERTETSSKEFRSNVSLVHAVAEQGAMGIITHKGLVLRTNTTQLQILQQSQKKLRTCMVFGGDFTQRFKHKGYKQNQKIKQVYRSLVAEQDTWLDKAWGTISNLGVNCLLVQGVAEEALVTRCERNDVIVIQNVPYTALQALSHYAHCRIATYSHLCAHMHVSDPVEIRALNEDSWMDCFQTRAHYITFHIPDAPLSTTILRHPVKAMAELRQEEFWHTFYRVTSAFENGKVLLGGGATEMHCAKFLSHCKDTADIITDRSGYSSCVFQAVSRGFQRYFSLVQQNTNQTSKYRNQHAMNKTALDTALKTVHLSGETRSSTNVEISDMFKLFDSDEVSLRTHLSDEKSPGLCHADMASNEDGSIMDETHYFDDFRSKTEAWMTACHTVCQLLCTDMEIVTGVDAFKQL